MDTNVVTFDKYFQRGHTYIALSSSRSLKGLYLRNFDKQYIKVKKYVTTEVLRLKERQLNTDCHSPSRSKSYLLSAQHTFIIYSLSRLGILQIFEDWHNWTCWNLVTSWLSVKTIIHWMDFASSEETGKIYTILVSSQNVKCVTIKAVLHCMSSCRFLTFKLLLPLHGCFTFTTLVVFTMTRYCHHLPLLCRIFVRCTVVNMWSFKLGD